MRLFATNTAIRGFRQGEEPLHRGPSALDAEVSVAGVLGGRLGLPRLPQMVLQDRAVSDETLVRFDGHSGGCRVVQPPPRPALPASTQDGANWNHVLAAAVVAVIPMLALFLVFQRQMVESIKTSGLK
ncbi:hypothetical protein [Streptomyces sp. NPDC058695]|uniref:hypothetical protein n=1 Tax=Streptomyces sp. NPDC058695 TaxID=3346604 RepID=UPI003653C844